MPTHVEHVLYHSAVQREFLWLKHNVLDIQAQVHPTLSCVDTSHTAAVTAEVFSSPTDNTCTLLDKREDYENSSVLYYVTQLCAVTRTLTVHEHFL